MNIALILSTNYPNEAWSLDGNEYAGLTWFSDSPKPTKAALEKQWPEVEHLNAVNVCNESRRNAYALESDPLFFKYQETLDEADRTAWLNKKAEIRERYPEPVKPETTK